LLSWRLPDEYTVDIRGLGVQLEQTHIEFVVREREVHFQPGIEVFLLGRRGELLNQDVHEHLDFLLDVLLVNGFLVEVNEHFAVLEVEEKGIVHLDEFLHHLEDAFVVVQVLQVYEVAFPEPSFEYVVISELKLLLELILLLLHLFLVFFQLLLLQFLVFFIQLVVNVPLVLF